MIAKTAISQHDCWIDAALLSTCIFQEQDTGPRTNIYHKTRWNLLIL